jgi:UDP-N-acetyl-D-mannosaminuronate dehydrogenase
LKRNFQEADRGIIAVPTPVKKVNDPDKKAGKITIVDHRDGFLLP